MRWPVLLLGVLALPVATPALAQSAAGGRPELLTVEGCGKALPVTIGNPEQFEQFGVDLDAYRRNEGRAIAETVKALCAGSKKYRDLIDRGIASLRVINAQGAMDPTPHVGGRVLLIEFVGGPIDKAGLRRDLMAALDKGSVVKPSFSCAKAARPIDRVICAEPDLARDDAELAAGYKAALATMTKEPDRALRLRNEQRDWLGERDAECSRGSDPADPRQADGMVNCLLAQYDRRLAMLSVLTDTPEPVVGSVEIGAEGSYSNGDGTVELSAHADGTAEFSLVTQAQRGACTIAGTARREGPASYVFRDLDTACKVTLRLDGDTLGVATEGACYRNFCGVHAPEPDGDYARAAKAKN